MEVTKPAGRKVLYFCPASMIGNVEREIRRWSPHRSVVKLGGQTKIGRKFLIETMLEHPEYVAICNYEAYRKDKSLLEDLIEIEFDTCIIDEAHNIKDRKSNAYRGIKHILTESNIPFVLPMTGTPILNKPQEFFTLLTLVDPKHFNDEKYFLRAYCQQDYDNPNKWTFQPGGVEKLFKQFSNLFLRRTKEQAGIILPPKTVVVHELEVDIDKYPMQAKARKEMREWGSIMLDPDKKKALSAMAEIAVYTRLRQIETWPANISVKDEDGDVILRLGDEYAESQKIDELISWENGEVNEWGGLIPEVAYNPITKDGERVVVFSQFIDPLDVLEERLTKAGYRVAMMTGKTSDAQRQTVMMDFDAKETTNGEHKYDIVLCHYRVGGVGMNLTNATQMFILDEEWNPGKRDQAYDRIHRMGQEKPVTIHVLRDVGTIDKWLADLIQSKEDMIDGFHSTADSMAQAAYDALKSGLI
jgi:SNF2 family DNA or RNA helicase